MRRNMIASLCLAVVMLAAAGVARGQSTHDLPGSLCSFQGTYNLICSTMGNVTIGDAIYGVSMAAPTLSNPSFTTGSISFQNLSTGAYTTMTLEGTYSKTGALPNEGGYISAKFNGIFSGTLEFDVVIVYPAKPPCTRYCYVPKWFAENVVLTID